MKKSKFNVGDQVTIYGDESTLYIVSDVHDYETHTPDGYHQAYDYEIIKIFPVERKSVFTVISEVELSHYAKFNDKMWQSMLTYIKREYTKNKWEEQPEFLSLVEANLPYSVSVNGVNIKTVETNKKKSDTVRYTRFSTVDEGLDRLSDLDMLIEMCGDDDGSLGQAKRDVLKKLKKIS